MGLDQYAFINPREEQRTDDEGNTFTAKIAEKDFYWRKRQQLSRRAPRRHARIVPHGRLLKMMLRLGELCLERL